MCKETMLVYSRVVGYYSPLDQWNKGKKEEYKMRKTFNLNEMSEAIEEDDKNNLSIFTV
jgi:ribonucleoside-triphosphate reductase